MSFILWQLCILQPQVAADICCLLGATSVNLIHWTEVFNDVWDVDTNYVTIISQAITLLVLKTCPVFRQSLKQLLPFCLSSQEKTVKMAHCWSKVRISITEKKDIFISTKKKKKSLESSLKVFISICQNPFFQKKKVTTYLLIIHTLQSFNVCKGIPSSNYFSWQTADRDPFSP